MPPDYRDLVIQDFADSEANLVALVESLRHDVDIYRRIANTVMTALQAEYQTTIKLRAEVHRLRDENTRLRVDHFMAADDEAA